MTESILENGIMLFLRFAMGWTFLLRRPYADRSAEFFGLRLPSPYENIPLRPVLARSAYDLAVYVISCKVGPHSDRSVSHHRMPRSP